jgi:hypothetical protein
MSIKVTRTPKSIITWHSVDDELPDAGIEVFAGLESGELVVAHYDDEQCVWLSDDVSDECRARWWAEMPEVPQ